MPCIGLVKKKYVFLNHKVFGMVVIIPTLDPCRTARVIAEALALVVHGDDDTGGELLHQSGGLFGVDGVEPAHGDEENVSAGEGGKLVLFQLTAQIAQMDRLHPLGGENMDAVGAPLGALHLVVEGGAGLDTHPAGVSGEPDRGGVAVVVVTVAAVNRVGGGADGAVAGDVVVGVGIDGDTALGSADGEAGVAVPGQLHILSRSSLKRLLIK